VLPCFANVVLGHKLCRELLDSFEPLHLAVLCQGGHCANLMTLVRAAASPPSMFVTHRWLVHAFRFPRRTQCSTQPRPT
jgi:hypothetical protein